MKKFHWKFLGKRFWPVGYIVIVWFIYASPYFLKGLVPFPSKYLATFFPPWSTQYGMPVKNNAMPDVITQIYPWKKITIDSWMQGQVPLWNPYSFSGTPHAGNYQTAVFSPVNLLYGIFSFLDAWSMSILFQPLLAGIFMYVFIRCLNRSQSAALIGSIAFMFCGFMTVWMAYGTLGWAVLWLPILFAAVLMHVHRRFWLNPLIIAFSLAWSFFSGHFQISVYVFIAVMAFIAYQMVYTKRVKACFELGLAAMLGLMLSAPQILPSLDAYSKSVRSELFTQGGGIAWKYLVTLFAPDFFGNPVTRNDWFGFYAEWASYIGVVPLCLSVYAIIRRTRNIGFFLGLALLSLSIATPTIINTLVVWLKIPGISTSYAARIIVLTSFSLAVISAYGFDRLREDWKKKHISMTFMPILGIGTFLVVLLGIVWFIRPFDADKLLIAKRNLIFPIGLISSFFVLALAGYINRWKFVQPFVIALFIIFVSFDMVRYAVKWMPFDPREFVYPNVGVLSFLQRELGHYRIFGNLGGEVTNGFAIPGIEGYDAVYQKRYGEFIRSVDEGKIIFPERSVVQFPKIGRYAEFALHLLGVKYVVHRLSDGRFPWAYPHWEFPYYKSIYKDSYYEVFENIETLPRAFLASSYVLADTGKNIIDALYQKDFNPQESLVLEREPLLKPQTGVGSVIITKYSPNEVVLQSKSAVPKLLFLSDAYDNGWRVTVDGQSMRLDRADYDFRAVALNPGDHTVRMVYWPKSFEYGLWSAFTGVILLISWSVMTFYHNKHYEA